MGSLKYRRMFFQILLSYLACSQIWLNFLWIITTLAIKQECQKKKSTGSLLWVSLLRWQQAFFINWWIFCQKTKLKVENWKWNDFGGFSIARSEGKKCKNCQISRYIFFETHDICKRKTLHNKDVVHCNFSKESMHVKLGFCVDMNY